MYTITAQTRDPKAKAHQLRRSGFVPCVIYGAQLPQSLSIQLTRGEAEQLRRDRRTGSKIGIQLGGTTYPTLIKELDFNTLTSEIIHVSFQLLERGKKINSVADIVLLNRDTVPGVLELMQLRVPHAAEPEYLLDTVAVDLENMPVGTTLTVGDISAFRSDKIELQSDPSAIVLRIRDKKRAEARFA